MHPLLARRERLLLYLGGWTSIGALLTVLIAPGRLGWLEAAILILPVTLLYGAFSLSTWYLVRAMPIATIPASRLVGVHIVAALVSSSGLVLLLQGWASATRGMMDLQVNLASTELRLLFGGGIVLYLLAAATHYLLAAFESSREAERHSFESQLLARESELKALRAQIDPHFLFNSLNSISALTTADPAAARTMTERLAGFFRASVDAGRQPLTTFETELTLVRQYLEIEKVRFGDRLMVSFNISDDVRTRRVPSLLLQPLIENAVKHGIARMLDGGCIEVAAQVRGSQVHVRVANPLDPESPPAGGTSFGLEAVRARLRAIAAGEASVDARREGGSFVVDIVLPSDL